MSALLFASALKGTVLVAFALIVHRVARNRVPSRWLCALFLVAIVRLLIPIAPSSSFSIFNLVPVPAPAPPLLIQDATTGGGAPPAPLFVRRAVPPPPSSPWTTFALALWISGALVLLGRTFVQSLRFHRRLQDGRDVDLTPLVDDCREALRVRRRVRVMVTNAVATPSLHGWLRPALLLPQGFLESFPREQQRYVVLHELAHLRRSDVLISWIANVARTLHWFNPLVHLAVARLAEERELACDALALDALRAEERPAYGGTVVELVDRLRGAHMVPALVGMTASPQQLKRRILMIASFRNQSRYSILFAAMVLAVALATLTDARAQVVHMRTGGGQPPEGISPGAQEVMKHLDQSINIDLTSAPLDDVLHAVSNATGVNFTIAPNAVEGSPRVTLKGTNVPAHLVMMETLSSLELAVRFTDGGVEVIPAPGLATEHAAFGMAGIKMRGDEQGLKRTAELDAQRGTPGTAALAEKRAAELAAQSDDRHVVFLRTSSPDAPTRIQVDADSLHHRKLTVMREDGSSSGTLEIDVEP
jgi:beta-lactamase regulating signal transducer with metallopeptidase domain